MKARADQCDKIRRVVSKLPDGRQLAITVDVTQEYAIYTRPRSTFQLTSLGSLTASSNRALLNRLLRDYNVALI
jgi:hypothetical protein